MKIIPLLLSLVVFVILSDIFISGQSEADIKNASTQEFSVTMPKRISDIPLAVEQKWLEQKAQRTQASNNSQEQVEEKNNALALTLANQQFTLYGIFHHQALPFILLKDENGKMIKLEKGASLANNAKLISITKTQIVFESENQPIEFNLFKRNTTLNDKNDAKK